MEQTFVGILQQRASRQHDRLAFTFLRGDDRPPDVVTYGRLYEHALGIAALFAGQKPGSRVLLLLPEGIEFIAALFGCWLAGQIPVSSYVPGSRRRLGRLEAIQKDAGCESSLSSEEVMAKLAPAFAESSVLRKLAVRCAGAEVHTSNDRHVFAPQDHDIALLQYTSGSTGYAKGVMVSHGNLIANSVALARAFRYTPDSHCFSWLPPYHDMGLVGCILQPLYGGFSSTLMPPASFLQKPLRWLQGISSSRATLSGAPDFAYDLCARKMEVNSGEAFDLSCWTVAFSGSEPVRAQTLDRFACAFRSSGFRREAFLPCYGLAESTLFVAGHSAGAPLVTERIDRHALERNDIVAAGHTDRTAQLVGCGRGGPEQELLIVNPLTCLPCTDAVGEIWLRSPSCAQGYWQQPETSRDVFHARLADGSAGEYLRTGDLGFIRNGELFITGRIKELLIIRGRNHYPQALEDTVAGCLELNPNSVMAFSVFEDGEERLIVAIEPARKQELYPPDVFEGIRERVSNEHEVNVWRFLITHPHGIPRTSSGKKQRNTFKADYLEGRPAVLEWPPLAGAAEISSRETELVAAGEGGDRVEVLRRLVAHHARLPIASIEVNVPLSRYGLDSLAAAEIAGDAEEMLGQRMSAINFISDQTIDELVLNSSPSWAESTPAADIAGGIGLSPGQQAIVAAGELSEAGDGLNIAQAFRIEGPVNSGRIKSALQLVVDRHQALRTICHTRGGSIMQYTMPASDLVIRETAVSNPEEAGLRLAQAAWAPFNRSVDAAMRVELIRVSPREAYLLIAIDHLFADLASVVIVIEDFKHAYTTGSLPELSSAAFFEHVAEIRNAAAGPRAEDARQAWSAFLQDPIEQISLPFERQSSGPPAALRPASFVRLRLDRGLADQVRALCAAAGVTVFTGLLAAFGGMLRRCGNTGRIAVAVPMHGRPGKRFARTVGHFVNVVPVIFDLTGDVTWRQAMAAARRAMLNAIQWQYLPLAEVIDLARSIHGPRVPLPPDVMITIYQEKTAGYDVVASMIGDSKRVPELPGFHTHPIHKYLTQFRLAVHLADGADGIEVAFEYDQDRFTEAEVRELGTLFRHTVRQMVARPDASASGSIDLPPEHYARISAANDTTRPYDDAALLHIRIEQQVARTPHREAVVFGSERLTFGELYRRVELLAGTLAHAGVGRNRVVAVFMERSIELVVALLGILKAGGAYLPLGTDYPPERLASMLADAKPAVTLVQPGLIGRLPDGCGQRISLGPSWGADVPTGMQGPLAPPSPDDLAYVIYTSGSTGAPNGVMNTHRGICNRLQWMQEYYNLSASDRVLQKTPYTFDVSVWEFFWPLLAGATLVIAPPGAHKDSRELCRLIIEERITTVHFVPSLLQIFLDERNLPDCTTLRRVICSGEALSPKLQYLCAERLRAEIHNLYGPTEAAVDATAWPCVTDTRLPVVPIGTPIANMQAHVLDRDGNPCPMGVAGMLHLGGVGLARGYWRRPGLTAERFIPSPVSTKPGERLYNTGDLARWRAEGYLEFLGRKDGQVKIHGCRIELAEIECALLRHAEITQCVVTVECASDHEPVLTAYITGKAAHRLSAAEVKAFLRSIVPGWMLPSHIVVLEALPLSANGKVDRKALATAVRAAPADTADEPVVRTPAEVLISGLWSEILQSPEIPPGVNFFDLGGHSLSALRLRARLEEELGVAVPFRALLDAPTVEETVSRIALHLAREDVTGRALGIIAELESMSPAELDPALEAARSSFARNRNEVGSGSVQ